MSLALGDLKYRLMEHMVYLQTSDYSETIEEPNKDGAKNFYIGTASELSNLVRFGEADVDNCFNKDGFPIHLPYYTRKGVHLVACVKDSSSEISKVNVYGVYTIAGMKDLVTTYNQKNFKWNIISISDELRNELEKKIITMVKGNAILLPTANYNQLSEEEKELKIYRGNTGIKKVPIKRNGLCSVS